MSALSRATPITFFLAATWYPVGLAGQSATEVFTRMLAEQDRRAARVENYTVVQDLMGTTVTMYLVKDAAGGHAVFRIRDMVVDGLDASTPQPPDDLSADLWTELHNLGAQARYVKQESLDGHPVHVIEVPDLSKVAAFREARQSPGGRFEAHKGTFYIDGTLWVPRRLIFEGRMTTERKTADVSMTMDMQDYREVEGMLLPFRGTVRMDGMVDERERAQFAEIQKQLAEMPEEQRKMMEQMMKGQLDRFSRMVSADGSVNFESTVREVRVNAGPPR